MEFNLEVENGLFKRLAEEPPAWWKNLLSDSDIYIDIRKNNKINAYINGGSILSLSGGRKYSAKIHFEYIPLKKTKDYLSCEFKGGDISIPKIEQIDLKNFSSDTLPLIKKRIKKFYPNSSEKGIQGSYVTKNHNKGSGVGFFIDTELQFTLSDGKDGRIDLVWVDFTRKQIALVELKTMSDGRLFDEDNFEPESIDIQLKKYGKFITENSEKLVNYYDKIFQIKKTLGLLPNFVKEETLFQYKLLPKPILLIGDCRQEWINANAKDIENPQNINSRVKNFAHSCIYQGINTHTFSIPEKSEKNIFVF